MSPDMVNSRLTLHKVASCYNELERGNVERGWKIEKKMVATIKTKETKK